MPIIANSITREPTHVDPIPHVSRVPSKREANDAYARILATLTFHQADALESDIEIVRDFVWSR